MRIGLIGWYGHDNAGDERILYCLRWLFDGHDLFALGGLDEVAEALPELNRCDFVLLGGGGLIMRGTGRFAADFERITAPFGCLGISIEAVHRDNQALIDLLRDKSRFIHVRDADSARILDTPTKVLSGTDLTFLYPYPISEEIAADVCGVNLRTWKYWAAQHRGYPDQVMGRIAVRFPALERHYPLRKWAPDRAAAIIRESFAHLVSLPLYNEAGACTDADVLQRYFGGADTRFAPDRYDACRYVIGMRLHALIFACQKGVPFVSLSYQPKNEAFCRDIGIPRASIDLCDLSSLRPAIARMKEEYRALRRQLLAYRERAREQSLADAATILAAMGCRRSGNHGSREA